MITHGPDVTTTHGAGPGDLGPDPGTWGHGCGDTVGRDHDFEVAFGDTSEVTALKPGVIFPSNTLEQQPTVHFQKL